MIFLANHQLPLSGNKMIQILLPIYTHEATCRVLVRLPIVIEPLAHYLGGLNF